CPSSRLIGGPNHDSQTQIGSVPALFPQDGSEDRQAPQPRHVPLARGSRAARTSGPVLQAPPLSWLRKYAYSWTSHLDKSLPEERRIEIMAKRDKETNGAKVPVRTTKQTMPTQTAERSRLPARRTEHPLRRLREEMDALFDRFFGHWPIAWEPAWLPEHFGG